MTVEELEIKLAVIEEKLDRALQLLALELQGNEE